MPDSIALAPAPRSVPLSLRVQLVLSGILPLIGWLVLGIGLVLSTVFLSMAEPLFGDPFAGPLGTLEGKVVEVQATNAKVNNDRVRAIHFEYSLGDRLQRGISYTTDAPPDVGTAVPVEYVRGHPAKARIRGMRTAMFPSIIAFVLVFPAIGGVLLLLGMVHGWRRAQLLQNGALARGRLVASRPTNTKINNQRVHELTFEFTDAAGAARRGNVRSHHLAALTDDAEEVLLYDPAGQRIVLWDMLPSRPELDRDGHFLPVGLGQLAKVLIAPTVVAVGVQLASSILAAGA